MILPIHPLMREQELLSSWMVRQAIANGYGIHTFYWRVVGYHHSLWTRDIDRNPPPYLLETLKKISGYSIAELSHHTMHRYIGSVFSNISTNGYLPWLIPLGIYHRQRRRMGLQFCPECLREDPITYFRQSWRLAFVAICKRHSCLLVSRCPGCQCPIAFHRSGIGDLQINSSNCLVYCPQCGAKLSNAPAHKINWPDKFSWRLYLALLEHFEDGLWTSTAPASAHMALMFRGIHAMLQVLIGRNGATLQRMIGCDLFGQDYNYGPIRAKDFEYLDVKDRLLSMLYVLSLIRYWPKRLVSMCNAAGITRSCFSENLSSLPYWLYDAVDMFLTKTKSVRRPRVRDKASLR